MANFKTKLRRWRGKRYQKEAASLLNISLRTYQNWEEAVNIPSRFAVAEIERLMALHPEVTEVNV